MRGKDRTLLLFGSISGVYLVVLALVVLVLALIIVVFALGRR